MNRIVQNFITVFSTRKYTFLAGGVSILYYCVNVLLTYWENLQAMKKFLGGRETVTYILKMFRDYYITVPGYIFLSLLVISVLFGVLTALISYKTIEVSGAGRPVKGGIIGSVGFFLGMFASSCVACGIGVFSLFGISAVIIQYLPWGGHGLTILSILILLGAIIRFTKNLYVCRRKIV